VRRQLWLLVILSGILFMISGCGTAEMAQRGNSQSASHDIDIHMEERPTPTPLSVTLQRQEAPATPTSQTTTSSAPAASPLTNIPGTGTGAAPYGTPAAMTNEERTLTQQLFTLINSDRAARGLYPFVWNPTLAGGARLHSWNMYHCGFSHTCPDGRTQCQRIEDEGFTGLECAEAIGYAGPYPTPYDGMHNIQESMVNEPPTGWHRIHLLSTTLHKVGVGIYVDPGGFIWFTEDFVS